MSISFTTKLSSSPITRASSCAIKEKGRHNNNNCNNISIKKEIMINNNNKRESFVLCSSDSGISNNSKSNLKKNLLFCPSSSSSLSIKRIYNDFTDAASSSPSLKRVSIGSNSDDSNDSNDHDFISNGRAKRIKLSSNDNGYGHNNDNNTNKSHNVNISDDDIDDDTHHDIILCDNRRKKRIKIDNTNNDESFSLLSPLERLLNEVHITEYRNIAFTSIINMIHKYPEMLNTITNNNNNSKSNNILIKFLSITTEEQNYNVNKRWISTIVELILRKTKNGSSLATIQSSHSGNTALHVALMHHGTNIDLIKLLILHDDTNRLLHLKNKKNELPLHLAIGYSNYSNNNVSWEVFQFILSKSYQLSSSSSSLSATKTATATNNVCLQQDKYGYTPTSLAWNKLIHHTNYVKSSSYDNNDNNEQDYITLLKSPHWCTILLLIKATHDYHLKNNETNNNNSNNSSSNKESSSMYLVHAAATASHYNVLKIALHLYPYQIYYPDMHNGKLPLHYCVSSYVNNNNNNIATNNKNDHNYEILWKDSFDLLLDTYPQAALFTDHDDRLPLHIALDYNNNNSSSISSSTLLHVIKRLLQHNPQSISRKDPITLLYPFMQAAATTTTNASNSINNNNNSSVDIIFYLLSFAPELVLESFLK